MANELHGLLFLEAPVIQPGSSCEGAEDDHADELQRSIQHQCSRETVTPHYVNECLDIQRVEQKYRKEQEAVAECDFACVLQPVERIAVHLRALFAS